MTLVSMLLGADIARQNGNILLNKKEENIVKAVISERFYIYNPLAKAVATGKDSYEARTKFIQEKFGFLRNIWFPKRDEAFDENVKEVIDSINDVDFLHSKKFNPYKDENRRRTVCQDNNGYRIEDRINANLFTTDTAKRNISFFNKLSLIGGIGLNLLVGFMEYEGYKRGLEFGPGKIITQHLIGLAIPYLFTRLPPILENKSRMNGLKYIARKTDEFLRQNYLPLPKRFQKLV